MATLEIEEWTLELLKRAKEETGSSSYDETIKKLVLSQTKSFGGILGPPQSPEEILKDLRDKSDRF